jgi:transposase InsO family protein
MDVKRLARFWVPGHRATGSREEKERNRGAGYEYLPCVVDDHSRLAYVELHPRESAETNARTLERALRFFAELGLDPPEALMTDNAMVYRRSHSLRELLEHDQIRHIRIPPYTPRWNGKVERFHQTMEREWAKGLRYRNSTARNRALPHWLRHYNQRRPHSSLGGQPPVSRAHNLPRQDT